MKCTRQIFSSLRRSLLLLVPDFIFSRVIKNTREELEATLLLCGYRADMDGDYRLAGEKHYVFVCFMRRHVHVYAILDSDYSNTFAFTRFVNRNFSYKETLKRLRKDRHII